MPVLNYTQRLTNLQNRKFDKEFNESIISKSFGLKKLSDNVKYLVKSMRPIHEKYNARTLDAANKVLKHLQEGYDLHFNRAYRIQGSVKTSTNIKVHSDLDLLTVIDRYYFPEIRRSEAYTWSDPDEDIKSLEHNQKKF
jgi:hypothetical protein